MAKKRKTKANGENHDEAVEQRAAEMLMPPSTRVSGLVDMKRKGRKRVGEINGPINDAITRAAEKEHLDKRAFNIVDKLDALSDQQIAITWPHLLRYAKDRGIPERATAQGELYSGNSEQTGEPETGNVTPIGAAGRKVAEAAGEKAQA